MKNLFLITSLIFMLSCSNDNSTAQSAFFNENQLYFNFKSENGTNLLDNSKTDSYKISSMKLFYLINDTPIEVKSENGFNSGSIELTPDKHLTVFTNTSTENLIEENDTYKTVENVAYLQLNENEIDTIKTYSKISKNYFRIIKVWYNDKQVFKEGDNTLIEIIK